MALEIIKPHFLLAKEWGFVLGKGKEGIDMNPFKYIRIVWAGLIALAIIIPSCENPASTSKSDEEFRRKYVFVKTLDETAYKDLGGLFHKVEMGTTSRIEITLDIKDRTAYGVATKLGPEMKKAGFEVLRIKDKNSDRYEDINL